MTRTRPAAVAGMFYPGDASGLRTMVDGLLDGGRRSGQVPADASRVKAVAVPHAGYVYSGSTAAVAYALLEQTRDRIERVVLLGPVHRVPVRGLALPEADAFGTPVGTAVVDDLPDGLPGLPQLVRYAPAHAQEHSLEVQFPFLQTVLPGVPVVPLACGGVDGEQVADVLDALWGGPETVVVVSTDLSHYLPYDEARAVDAGTIDDVLALREVHHEQACGATPLNGLVVAARRHGLAPSLLAHCNSGDTAGDRRRVVGYASFAFEEGR